MKPPKLIGNLTPDAAVGFADARALQNTGAPYLTSAGPGYTARLKNGFVEVQTHEVTTETAKPYLWFLLRTAASVLVSTNYRKLSVTLASTRPKKLKNLGAEADTTPPNFYPIHASLYVGGGKHAVMKFRDDSAQSPMPLVCHAVLMGGKSRAEAPSTSAVGDSFRSIFATGWDAAAEAWVWGFCTRPISSWVPPSTGGHYQTGPAGWVTSAQTHISGVGTGVTETGSIQVATDERMQYSAGVFCAGPGKLLALTAVPAYRTTAGAWHAGGMFLSTSADHGRTWAHTESLAISALFPTWRLNVNDSAGEPVERSVILARPMFAAMRTTQATYIGEGKTLLLVNAYPGWVEYGVVPVATSLCFLIEGATATQLSWNPSAPTNYTPGTSGSRIIPDGAFTDDHFTVGLRSRCFGPGCFAAAVFGPSSSTRLRVTRDFGATWEDLDTGGFDDCYLQVLSPYRSAERPGSILAFRAEGTNLMCYKTDGLFTAFTSLGAVAVFPSALDALYGGPIWVNTRKHLYPELPDEFGPP